MELSEITKAESLHLEPGDCLVVHVARPVISEAEADFLRERIREITGRPALRVLFLTHGMSVKVIPAS
jgi:hypothetical protein